MEVSEAELLLAYRQAKHALYQEERGFGRIALAKAEARLPELLRRLKSQLRAKPGWFSRLSIGQVWLLPKSATGVTKRSGIVSVGGDYSFPLQSLTVRPYLSPSAEFAIVEVLWLWMFGPALEVVLTSPRLQ
jgi:hypothetical protein